MTPLHRHDAKIDRLKSIPLFRNADKKALEHLASAADEITVPAGTALITEDHRHTEGYLIVEGTVTVEVGGNKVADVPAGELIGELALFGDSPVASATVKTATETSVLVIPYNRFDQILDDNPALTKAIAKQLAVRLQKMDQLYEER
jgi:CRP-like cAMP-binding protein